MDKKIKCSVCFRNSSNNIEPLNNIEIKKITNILGLHFSLKGLCRIDFNLVNRELKEKGFQEQLIIKNNKWRVIKK